MPDRVRITDVSPRDGLQNEPGVIPSDKKRHLVRLLAAAGVDEIEVSSFVSARWVPQLGDAAEVFAGLASEEGAGWPVLSALVPNEKGMEAALEVNAKAGRGLIGKVSVFTAASETFARKNINASIAESIHRFRPVVDRAHAEGLVVRGYISCAISCPFEGPIEPARVGAVAVQLLELGVEEIDLGDTIGAGEPASVAAMLERVTRDCRGALAAGGDPRPMLTLHLHDTFGRAAACVREALKFGVRSFDGAAGGLGGCPYASTPGKRAPGNIATETLVRIVREAGYECGVDEGALAEAGTFARTLRGGA